MLLKQAGLVGQLDDQMDIADNEAREIHILSAWQLQEHGAQGAGQPCKSHHLDISFKNRERR